MDKESNESQDRPALRRLAETGRMELPVLGDVLVFDKEFWKEPLIWKVPHFGGYVPTWAVLSAPLAGMATKGALLASLTVFGENAIELQSSFEGLITLSPAIDATLSDLRFHFTIALSSFFTVVSFTCLQTAAKYYGFSRKAMERDPNMLEIVQTLRKDDEIDTADEKSILKMIFSAEIIKRFMERVRRRHKRENPEVALTLKS